MFHLLGRTCNIGEKAKEKGGMELKSWKRITIVPEGLLFPVMLSIT